MYNKYRQCTILRKIIRTHLNNFLNHEAKEKYSTLKNRNKSCIIFKFTFKNYNFLSTINKSYKTRHFLQNVPFMLIVRFIFFMNAECKFNP